MCLFEAGASMSAQDAETTIKNSIVSTYTIKIKEIMVDIVHCRHKRAAVVVISRVLPISFLAGFGSTDTVYLLVLVIVMNFVLIYL
jgi:hypothetical protein